MTNPPEEPPNPPPNDPPNRPPRDGQSEAGKSQRPRVRRGAAPRDAVPRMEHFQVTAADKKRRLEMENTSRRLLIAAGGFAFLVLIVAFRVAWVTVIHPVQARIAAAPVPKIAQGPLKPITDTIVPGQRAMIVDRMGQPLALSEPTRSVFADPTAVGDPAEAARLLKSVLPRLNVDVTIKRLSDHAKKFVYLERQITPDEEAKINNLGIPSVDFRDTQQRHYPLGRVAAHIIGGVDIDEIGVSGAELAFDERIRKDGEPLRLSIDNRVQSVVREELEAAKNEFNAIGAAGIVMDVNTGELLAVVSLPDYDANDFRSAPQEQRFDRALSGRYEPGSTFKLQTLSMGLDSGLVHVWDYFDAANVIKIGRFTITDFEGKHRSLALPEVLAYSSNLGAARIAHVVGGERQRAWLRNMGMFDRVPVELREADRPQFHSEAAWGDAVNYTVGFGHGISVTPLHVVAGTAAIANGGILRHPTILRMEPGTEAGGTRVMAASTSELMRRLMRLVVTEGFGKKAEVHGYFPGGKTGTAEKNSGHGYKKHANVSAFMSVFPMQAPRYAVYMMLDEPHGNASTGFYSTAGQVSAPAAGRVIARIGPILGLMPETANFPAIEQALAIPLQPPRGFNPGPIRVPAPAPAAEVRPANLRQEPARADTRRTTQAEPAKPSPSAGPVSLQASAPPARVAAPRVPVLAQTSAQSLVTH